MADPVESVGFVSDTDVDKLDAAVRSFDEEVKSAAGAAPQNEQASLVEFYQVKVFPMVQAWRKWVVDHTGFLDRFDDSGYAENRGAYMAAREAWIKRGKTTQAPPVTSSDSDVTGDVKGTISDLGTKALIAAVLLGGVYIYANRGSR